MKCHRHSVGKNKKTKDFNALPYNEPTCMRTNVIVKKKQSGSVNSTPTKLNDTRYRAREHVDVLIYQC